MGTCDLPAKEIEQYPYSTRTENSTADAKSHVKDLVHVNIFLGMIFGEKNYNPKKATLDLERFCRKSLAKFKPKVGVQK